MAKCPYCDFNSHVRHEPVDQERFAGAFETELATMRRRTGPREVTSIFLGGGTPSLMQPETVGAVLDAVAKNWTVPGYRGDAGGESVIRRGRSVPGLSYGGGQSRLARHAGIERSGFALSWPAAQCRRGASAIDLARKIFPRLSFDLIYARPGQTLEAWEAELEEAIGYAADHLSLYQLTIEEGTRFHSLHAAGKFEIPDSDQAADLYAVTQEVTAARGLPAYEISNHAVPGAESRHNLMYWRYGEYVGVGPGAHGRFLENGRRIVTVAEKMPETWANLVEARGHGITGGEVLTRSEEADEFLLMGLRLAEGIDLARYEAMSGKGFSPTRLSVLQEEGLVASIGNSRLRATPSGMIVLDAVVADLAR